MIRQDQIDILIDLAGHSVPNRLPVFARRPVPVQATWMGYAGTTGSSAFDFIIADRWLVPPGDESAYRERVIRLPDSNVCLTLDDDLPPVAPPPSLASGRVTFGSFLNPTKLTPLTYDLWSAVLRKLPESRLILKFRGLNEPQVADRICGALVERTVDAQPVAGSHAFAADAWRVRRD